MIAPRSTTRPPSTRLRWRVLGRLEHRLELPMAVLGFVWLALFITEAVRGPDPLLTLLGTTIWVLFVADFLLRLALAPDRPQYLRRSWLTAISLLLPALRVFRVASALRALRAARAVRGVRLVRAVASLNRGLGALGRALSRHGVWYVGGLVTVVCFAGAAGMYLLEPHATGGRGFASYSDALWWTAMIMTTLGSAYWPQTGEGRVLAVLISLVAISVFGYVTATLASFLVGRDAASGEGEVAGTSDIAALRREIGALRRELAARRGDSTPS